MTKKTKKPRLNPKTFTIAPGGAIDQKKQHLIGEGNHVKIENNFLMEISSTNYSRIKKLEKIKLKSFLVRKIKKGTSENFTSINQLLPPKTGWIVYAGWMNREAEKISYFKCKWIVPQSPTTDNGQVIFLFNGIENKSLNKILQPVLQWGQSTAGGGNYWAITNWFVNLAPGGGAVYKELIKVYPGDILEGVIKLVKQNGSKFSYLSSFTNYPECDLLVENIEELVWANVALECRRLQNFSDYPNEINTEMSSIEIHIGDRQAQLSWEPHNRIRDNNQQCIVISNASPGGSVNLLY